jgi:uncharacterized protein YneF (UPF0154 family)
VLGLYLLIGIILLVVFVLSFFTVSTAQVAIYDTPHISDHKLRYKKW